MTKQATCASCANKASSAIDRGSPGASAAREWERRHSGREKRVRQTFGRLGGIVHALTDDPQSTTAWAIGARGERQLGVALDVLLQEGLEVLHDRRVPGTRANIDHLVIGPGGVYVVDAKRYEGKVEARIIGSLFSAQRRLFVGNRERSKLVAAMRIQAGAVRTALESITRSEVPVTPLLCFVESNWRPFAKPILFDDVHVLWPKALGKLVREPGPLDRAAIQGLAIALAGVLPKA